VKNIKYQDFKFKKKNLFIKKELYFLLKKPSEVLNSFKSTYKYSFSKKIINKFKKISLIRIIGMGGSILGTRAIFDFLSKKIKKKVIFTDDLDTNIRLKNDNLLNIIVSKSGNTLETISNVNLLIKNKNNNIFIVENNKSYLKKLALQLKAEIIDHNNYIGGRYSVLSEVGMVPAELMGLDEKKFKQFNNLINKKNFIDNLLNSVSSILHFHNNEKRNSVILNYDTQAENLFKWYQQLVAESLGKKSKGILPIISSVPKDNHSTMQFYLDGPKNYFFTFFFTNENNSPKINNKSLLSSFDHLKNKDVNDIKYSQKKATELVFQKKKIPFRSFEVYERSEQTLGELFTFFMLETILLAKVMKINPFDQPSVELVKTQTKKYLSRK